MNQLLFQATALCIDQNHTNIVVAGVGPSIFVIQDQKIIKRAIIMENSKRILSIQQFSNLLFTYSENILIILSFSIETLNFQIVSKYEFPDIIKATFYNEDTQEISAILGHGQILHIKQGNQTIHNPKNWVIVTAATIKNDHFFYGDSFGTLTYADHFDFETEYGTLFCIKESNTTNQIVTAHEYKAACLWNLEEDHIEKVWECTDFSSRVWGCDFFKGFPIAFSEDGCIHYNGQIYQVHRSKTITAMAINGDTIITSGQYGTVRFSNFSHLELNPINFTINKHLSVSSFIDGTCIVGTVDGNLILLPNNDIVYSDQNNENLSWFLISSYKTSAICSSRNKRLLFYNKDKFDNGNCSFIQTPATAIAISLSEKTAIAVLGNSTLLLLSIPLLTIIRTFDISDCFPTPHVTVTVCDPCFSTQNENPNTTVALAALSKVLIMEFNSDYIMQSKQMIETSTSDGFISLYFANSTMLYCAGRLNGTLSIIERTKRKEQIDNSCWHLKTHYRIPWQSNNIFQICGYSNTAIVAALVKNNIALFDMTTQTTIARIPIDGNKKRISLQVENSNFTLSYCDSKMVTLLSHSPCLSTNFVGQMFHGLRIISSATISANPHDNNNILVTGSCDRDIRLWNIDENGLVPLDCVSGSIDGTHSLCIGQCNCKERPIVIFSGGAKKYLFAWELINGRIVLLKEFVLDQYGISIKVDFTTTCCSLVPNEDDNLLYFGTSDGFLNIFRFLYNDNDSNIEIIERKELKGTPMSIDSYKGNIAVSESTGDLYLESKQKNFEIQITNCGIAMLRLIPIQLDENADEFLVCASACDDGYIVLTDFSTGQEIQRIKAGHCGGIRSIAVNVTYRDSSNLAKSILIATFSYDQRCVLHELSPNDFGVVKRTVFRTSIYDGERIEFVNGHIVVLGSGMEIF